MAFKVEVKFRKPVDFSNVNLDSIIRALPGPYKVSREALSGMGGGAYHSFSFDDKAVAKNFVNRLMESSGSFLDIKPESSF